MSLAELHDAWRSGQHVGPRRLAHNVVIRTGRFRRSFAPWTGGDVDARIWGESRARPWQATWVPESEWVTLPNVLSIDITQDFDSNGIAVCTLVLENVLYPERVGPGGDVYHLIQRGALAPFRGSRDGLRNEWYGMLQRNAQVFIEQGYGENLQPTFTGLIDDCDMQSSPDRITLTIRDFAQVLVDEHVFGWNASPQLPEPTVFRPMGMKGTGKAVGHGAAASSSSAGHLARFIEDRDSASTWISADHTTPDATEWVQLRLPRGRYESFAIQNAYPGMEVFVGVYARGASTLDGATIAEGWVQGPDGGVVPGANGGWNYLRRWQSMSDRGHSQRLGHVLELGDDSVMRVGFRNLRRVTPGVHRAGVARLAAVRRTIEAAKKVTQDSKIVEAADIADIVQVVLRWAGFKEWRIENANADYSGKLTYNRANTLMDVIGDCQKTTGFVFYMAPPTSRDSLGVPVFESNAAIYDASAGTPIVRDSDLLTGIQAKATDEPLAYIVRVRGKESRKYGLTIGQSLASTRRVMAVYRPPWWDENQLAGVIKHVIITNEKLNHTSDCMVMAQLYALQMALAAVAAQIEIPGHPGFLLNSQAAIVDTGTGLNTRLLVARRSSSYRAGENASWKMTLGGALLDTPNVQAMIGELRGTLRERTGDYRVGLGDPFNAAAV